MNFEEILEAIFDKGETKGIEALHKPERALFLISEAEILCDMEGIDSFLDRYPKDEIFECAQAFQAIGALHIGKLLKSIVDVLPERPDELLDQTNQVISDRLGYDYNDIQRWFIENNKK